MHNMNIFDTSLEEAIKTAIFYKDEQGILRKKTNDYSGLNAAIANELYVEAAAILDDEVDDKDR